MSARAPRPPAGDPAPAARARAARTARWIAVVAFLLYAATGGGRIVGSDELAMYQLGRALLHGGIAVPEGATLRGPDGRSFTKNAAGQAILALPLTAAAEAAGALLGPRLGSTEMVIRAKVSFFNALVCAALLGLFYAAARRFGATPGAALGAALLLGFATPLWVYSKSFMAEPLQALGLLLALDGAARAAEGEAVGERRAAWGLLIAGSVKSAMLAPAAIAVLPALRAGRWRWPALALLVTLAGHALYNAARFGNPLESGYGAQATPAAYSTPLLVGLYGLLLSSGKGLAWFAPPAWMFPAGARALWRRSPGAGGALLGLAVVMLALYATFEHWAGDGSFGPRYLLPLLPVAMLGVALRLGEPAARGLRRAAVVLGVLGVLVQVGGVAIYFGAQMRERGDYPYTLPLDDPRFMSESHWNPYFTPIADHWRLLGRNLHEHLAGRAPRVRAAAVGGDPAARTGLQPEAEAAMLHGFDFWWCYARYAGLPALPVAAALALLLVLAGLAGMRLRAALRAEAGP